MSANFSAVSSVWNVLPSNAYPLSRTPDRDAHSLPTSPIRFPKIAASAREASCLHPSHITWCKASAAQPASSPACLRSSRVKAPAISPRSSGGFSRNFPSRKANWSSRRVRASPHCSPSRFIVASSASSTRATLTTCPSMPSCPSSKSSSSTAADSWFWVLAPLVRDSPKNRGSIHPATGPLSLTRTPGRPSASTTLTISPERATSMLAGSWAAISLVGLAMRVRTAASVVIRVIRPWPGLVSRPFFFFTGEGGATGP
mmetsp:Transcript_33395/g.76622  ORF Transcript_33395/g.76622 Transcript_33395/m.76622 type:complete len:258 (+) Transcript_33395:817-1590(+)